MAKDELLRIYTPQGIATEQFKMRDLVHKDGDWHATVHLWVVNSKDELLFQKRSDSAEIHPGLWDVSAAGHVVGSDSLEVSVQREADEELGLKIALNAPQFLFSLETELKTEALNEKVFQYIFLLEKDVDSNELILQQEEVSQVTWHHYSILKRMYDNSDDFVPRLEEYEKMYTYLSNYLTQ